MTNNTNSNGTRIETDSNNDYWTDLGMLLQTLIGTGKGGPSSPVPRRAWSRCVPIPKELKAVREFPGPVRRTPQAPGGAGGADLEVSSTRVTYGAGG